MRAVRLYTGFLFVFICFQAKGQDKLESYFREANRFFSADVHNGKVDYQAILEDPSRLNRMLSMINASDPSMAGTDVKKAYWINTYNILVIRSVLQHYPVASVDGIPDFFSGKYFVIRNERLSLDMIEQEKLLQVYRDPKIRFALCKGGSGSPPLAKEAYTPEMITTMIRNQTEAAINDSLFVKAIENGVFRLHVLFKDAEPEITLISGSLQAFINRYRKSPAGNDSMMVFYKPPNNLNDTKVFIAGKSGFTLQRDTMSGTELNYMTHSEDSGTSGVEKQLMSRLGKEGNQPGRFFIEMNVFLGKYVYDGKVDYFQLKKNPRSISKLMAMMQETAIANRSNDTRKAYWLNVYNLFVIKTIIDHYPVASVTEIPGFFEEKRFTIHGELLSLNDIEQGKLMEEFRDPRLNFLICKGSLGDPPLFSEAFVPELMSTQIISRTLRILDDTAFVKVVNGTELQLADFFKENAADFRYIYGGLYDFLKRYKPVLVLADSLISYFSTSTLLNEDLQRRARLDQAVFAENLSPVDRENEFTSEADDGNLSSLIILPRNQFEIRLNNNLNSYKEVYGTRFRRVENPFRYVTNITTFQIFYGVGRKTSIGLNLITRSSLLSDINTSSWNVLRFHKDTNSVVYLRSLCPVIRFNIAEGFFQLRMQNTFTIPLSRIQPIEFNGVKLKEKNPYSLESQLFIYHYFSEYVKIMLEAGVTFRFDDQIKTFTFSPRTPLSLVFGLPVRQKLRIFALMELVPVGNIPGYFKSFYMREGAGFVFRAGKQDFSFYYSYNFIGRNTNVLNSFVLNCRIAL